MPTYRLTVEYEGTRYHGWQEQKNARSVAGELRRAIEEAGAPVRELGGSGRTDARGHAPAQGAHLRLARAGGAPRGEGLGGLSRAVPPGGQRPVAGGRPRARAGGRAGPLPFPPRRGLSLVPLPDLAPAHGARQALRLVGEAAARREEDGGGGRAPRRQARFPSLLRASSRAAEHAGGGGDGRGGHRRRPDPGPPRRLPLPVEDGAPGGGDAG